MAPRICVFVIVLIGVTELCGVGSADHIYTHEFAVHVQGGRSVADRLAEKYGYTNNGQIGALEDHYLFTHHKVSKRSADPSTGSHTSLVNEPEVHWMEQQVVRKRVKRSVDTDSRADLNVQMFDDDLWSKQWYMRADSSMNIQKAWKLGFTGKGVVVTILDDGLEYTHSDIRDNYDAFASYDFNSNDADPMPRYSLSRRLDYNQHGTRCAGEIVMQANNGKCGVGVAYNASIGGIRMLDGAVTDVVEANSLSFNSSHIDIYSVSWGPDDDGRTVEGPGTLAQKAFYSGITEGRDGRGSIFVWASGNGGRAKDHCGCDGYVNSIYTISIGSATERQAKPWYSEECSSILASTFSSGDSNEQKVVTTDLHNECYGNFTGTSASAPIAAGIYALALQAKPTLTWRDTQYLTVVTSKRHQLSGQWTTNGAGYDVSHIYGFGLMDAGAMVERAVTWETLPQQHLCRETVDSDRNGMRFTGKRSIIIQMEGCSHYKPVNYLEHVQLSLSLSVSRRGNAIIKLTSPSGTTCTLLGRRSEDNLRQVFSDWTFMSTHFWGENPTGDWVLTIEDASRSRLTYFRFRKATLHLWGTETLPNSLQPNSRVSRAIEDSSWWDSSWWWSSSEGESFDTCHIECLYGCDGPTAKDCYKCRHYKDRETKACVAECPEGQFTPPELHVRCGRCNGNCKTCTGSKKTDCLSCGEGQYLTDRNECSDVCGAGYYADQYFRMCRQCNPLCTKCTGNEYQCTACVPGAVLRGSQCMLTCMESEYMEGQTCRPCDSSCYQCDGPAKTDCTACYNDRVHKDMQCVDPGECRQGYYLQASFDAVGRQCLRCHATCMDCQGPSFTDCVACRQGSFLVGGACLQTCENGKFLDEDGACKWCDDGCAICADREHCIQCEDQMVLKEEGNNLVCREGCEEGYYSMEGECFQCHATCQACNGGGIMDCTRCKQIGEGHKYLLEGACVSFCPVGFYELEYDGDFLCEECDESCSHCTGPRSTQCTECESGLTLPEGVQEGECRETTRITCEVDNCDDCIAGNGNACQTCSRSYFLDGTRCVVHCPNGTYSVDDDGTCRLCHPSCKTCQLYSDQCTSCDPAYYLDLVDNLCLTQCPDDTYMDDVNKRCVLCHDSCATCSGGGENDCTSCYGEGDFLSGTRCVQRCPNGLYGDAYTGTCRDCHPSCVTCSGPGDHECESCNRHFNLGDDGACHSTCEDKQYKDDLGCHSCNSRCETCMGPDATDCLSCTYYLFLSSGQCVPDCEDHFYPDYESNVCRPCHSSCKTCLEAGEEDCIECSDSTYMLLKNGQLCVDICPEGYYESEELGFRDCRQCSIECRDCQTTYLNCISCRDETYLYQGRCFSTCPSGYYEDQETNHCIQQTNLCPLYCTECDDWGDCTVCDTGYVEYFGECVDESTLACPTNQFIEAYNSDGEAICRDCHESCSTCLGPTDNDCVSCLKGSHFQGSRCVSDCAEDEYLDLILSSCFACHPTCATCDGGSPSDCTSCPDEMTLSGPRNHGECRFGCRKGQYLDNSGECQDCADSSCTLCSGPEPEQCLTCKLGYFKSVAGGCTESCALGSYAFLTDGPTVGSECRSCHASCHSCVGPAMDQCRSCNENMVYMNGLCLWDCDSGYYPDDSNICRLCDTHCRTCSGPTARNCTSCKIDEWLQVSECVDECESDWFEMNDETPRCLECDPSCLTCTDYGPFDCTTCPPHHQLVDGVCYNRCGQQRFYSRKTDTCVTCHEDCHNCFGPDPDQCIDCRPGHRLEKVDRNHSKCIPCCDDVQEGLECCDTCKPDYVKCLKSYVRNPPPTSGPKVSIHHVGTIVFAVIMVVVVFFLVFGLLQARSHGKLCWARKYAKVPSYYNTKDKYVTLGKPDDDYYEEDIYGDVSEEEDDDADEIDHLQTGVHRTVDRNGIIDHL